MTDYDQKRPRCYGCSRESGQTVLMSTNSFGSPGLDQRATLACPAFGFRRRKGSPGPPFLATIPILAILVSSCFATSTGHAECPNLYGALDDQAQRAGERFNGAGPSSACSRAEEVVRIERRLSRFVEEYQVQCVIDQEIIDVQTRRVRKAREAQSRVCDR